MSYMRSIVTLLVLGLVIVNFGIVSHYIGRDDLMNPMFIAGDLLICLAGLLALPRFIRVVKIGWVDIFLAVVVIIGVLLIIFS